MLHDRNRSLTTRVHERENPQATMLYVTVLSATNIVVSQSEFYFHTWRQFRTPVAEFLSTTVKCRISSTLIFGRTNILYMYLRYKLILPIYGNRVVCHITVLLAPFVSWCLNVDSHRRCMLPRLRTELFCFKWNICTDIEDILIIYTCVATS